MPPINLLVKPASSNCNLRCTYCFYHSIAENRQINSFGIMDVQTLELLVKKALEYADHVCTFAFQGGEPTLAGLDFFKKLIEFEKKYNVKNVQINNAIQTNGMAIDDDWAKFLSENKFLVGLSLDGPKDINDSHRIDSRGKGSFLRIMETISLFNKHKVEYNILTVVTSNVARHISKIYKFFKKQGFRYLQFIPCLDPLGEQPGGYAHSLAPERYSYFLRTLFDQWYDDIQQGNMISIRYFDNIVGIAMGYRPEACGMSGSCMCQFVVEADGGVYPCDFYVIDRWCLGNVKDKSLEDIRDSDTAREFVEVSRHTDPKCGECKWFALCRGGCRRDREPFENEKPILNRYCSSYFEFFEHAGNRIFQLARMFSQR
jgi:uncharacterized protein